MPIISASTETELPEASTLADSLTIPVTPLIGAQVMGYNANNGKAYFVHAYDASVDDLSPFRTGLVVNSVPYGFNGTTMERLRDNMDVTLLASAARTITTASADQTNYNARGVKVVLDMTVVGTGSVTLTIQGKDAVSGKYYTLLAGAAVTTNSTNVYTVFPGSTVTANVAANDILPRTWRVNCVANNANSATYSVGASVIL